MKKQLAYLLPALLLLLVAACANRLQENEVQYHPSPTEVAWIKKELLSIKQEMRPDGAMSSPLSTDLRWKIADCVAYYPPTAAELKQDSLAAALRKDQNQLNSSRSDDLETHGQALYRLFVRDPIAYSQYASKFQPGSQAIVKATYKPVPLERAPPHSNKQAALGADGKWYREGDPDDLYIMFRTNLDGIQTDAGWVYGVVSAHTDSVIAQGLLQNCMGCHRQNAPDRLFGLPAQ